MESAHGIDDVYPDRRFVSPAPRVLQGRIRQCPEYADVQRQNAEDSLKWIDTELANRRFIAGDKFTIADITAMVGIDFGRISKIAIQPDQRNLARWHAEVSARPSAKA